MQRLPITIVRFDGVSADVLTTTPVTFIDTAGAGYDEEEPDGQSRLNPQEAELVARKVSDLLNAVWHQSKSASSRRIQPRARTLRMLLPETVEVNSVDGFQGREKECIVISWCVPTAKVMSDFWLRRGA